MGKALILKVSLSALSAFIFFSALIWGSSFGGNNFSKSQGDEMIITTLFDNYQWQSNLKTGWGFSALIQIGDKSIIFDTGADGSILLENIDKLGLKPQEVDALLLSHNHGDHTGGLEQFLSKWGAKKVYIPQSFASRFEKIVEQYAKLVEVEEAMEIIPSVFTTGEMGTFIIEQSMVMETGKGLVIVTGCAHPGIVKIVRRAKELRQKEVYLVIGGFHLGGKSDREMADIIKAFRSLGVKKVSPSHCTGSHQIELFKEEYGDSFIRNGVGKKIIIEE